ncbi:MAG TPA: Hsp70 family protein [Mycobacterium sp.]|nr:Hsp70 family protein [Mycobacterium sp.]
MSESLGLSLGVANLVAARVGSTPVARKPVLTVYDQRASEVGLPEENPNLTVPGLVMRGFIERVGDRAELVAADGTKYLGEALTVEALEAMVRTVGSGTPLTIAVPAYWSEGQYAALRAEFFAQPALAPNGVPPVLMSDATAAVTALRATPGFPTDGIVVLCDFGASGTSVTLTNAGANFQQVGPSVRYTDFSGDAIDQLILNHLRTAAPTADTTTGVASTTRMGSLTRLLAECQRAKEHLSTATMATVGTDSGENVRLSRSEFEQLISEPLDRLVGTVKEILQRNGILRSNLAAIATVGGGASIPLLTTRLSGRLRVPILTTPQPAYSAAIGAAVLGQQQSSAGAATAASPILDNPTETVATAAGLEKPHAPVAWSEDAGTQEPVPYTGPEHTGDYGRDTRGLGYANDHRYSAQAARLPWYKRTALVLSVAGAGAAVLVAVVLALTLGHANNTPPNEPAPPQTSQTITVTGPNNSPTVTVIPPPPTTNTTQPPATTTTNQPPTTTTTTTAPPTTTTTKQTTTSQVTTTAPSTTTQERPFPPRR